MFALIALILLAACARASDQPGVPTPLSAALELLNYATLHQTKLLEYPTPHSLLILLSQVCHSHGIPFSHQALQQAITETPHEHKNVLEDPIAMYSIMVRHIMDASPKNKDLLHSQVSWDLRTESQVVNLQQELEVDSAHVTELLGQTHFTLDGKSQDKRQLHSLFCSWLCTMDVPPSNLLSHIFQPEKAVIVARKITRFPSSAVVVKVENAAQVIFTWEASFPESLVGPCLDPSRFTDPLGFLCFIQLIVIVKGESGFVVLKRDSDWTPVVGLAEFSAANPEHLASSHALSSFVSQLMKGICDGYRLYALVYGKYLK